MTVPRLRPHMLYLCADPGLVRAQRAGRRRDRAETVPVRDDIANDEISPRPGV